MPLSAMTYVWDAENAPGNALHPSLRLYRGMQLSRIHPTSTLLLPVQKKEVRAMNSKKTKKETREIQYKLAVKLLNLMLESGFLQPEEYEKIDALNRETFSPELSRVYV